MNIAEIFRTFIPREFRNWCRSPAHTLHHMWNSLRFHFGNISQVQLSESWKLHCHPLAEKHFSVFNYDRVQTSELETFITNCPSGVQLLDIGAHYGIFTLAAIHHGGRDARVLCVEASPSAAAILTANLRMNDATNQATILNVAIGAEDGYMQMLSTGPLTGGYFIRPNNTRNDTVEVPQLSLASILGKTNFHPTHVKMDIEGCEYEVIESSQLLLKRLRPVIFLELHGSILRSQGKAPARVIETLRNNGYTTFKSADESLPSYDDPNFDNCRLICS
jgi:FkbM family methyltransferase